MIHEVLLVAVLTLAPDTTPTAAKTPIQQCFATMDGAVYHGDPSDRQLMRANVATCERGIAQVARMRPGTGRGPEKLFLTARILDRAATLSYMGLDDAPTALREVRAANLYFRIASGLPQQSAEYHQAAVLNAELTHIQLQTLRTDIVAAAASRAKAKHDVATRAGGATAAYTAAR